MIKRVVAALAAGVAVLLVCAVGAGAQTYPPEYPPAPDTITVDDPTPDPGQVVTVTLATCRPGSLALLGIDLWLLGAPVVGADGVARAQVTVPASIRPGRHMVAGVCIKPSGRPLFLTTRITVPGRGGATGGGGGARAATGSGGSGPTSLDALAGPALPPDAALIYQTTALTNGITDRGSDAREAAGARPARRDSSAGADDGPGTLAAIARVTLGLLAIGGVPVALAISRRPSAKVRSGFARASVVEGS